MFIQMTLSAVFYSLKDSILSNLLLLTTHLQDKQSKTETVVSEYRNTAHVLITKRIILIIFNTVCMTLDTICQ